MSNIQKREAELRSLLNNGVVTQLNIEDNQIVLVVISDSHSPNTTRHNVGSLQDIKKTLRHEPATAIELESAIAEIEDRLIPIITLLPKSKHLVTSALAVFEIAKVAGFDDPNKIHLKISTVELLFNRLAEVAYGTPPEHLGVPTSRAFTAILFLLRELLHHAGFNSVILLH